MRATACAGSILPLSEILLELGQLLLERLLRRGIEVGAAVDLRLDLRHLLRRLLHDLLIRLLLLDDRRLRVRQDEQRQQHASQHQQCGRHLATRARPNDRLLAPFLDQVRRLGEVLAGEGTARGAIAQFERGAQAFAQTEVAVGAGGDRAQRQRPGRGERHTAQQADRQRHQRDDRVLVGQQEGLQPRGHADRHGQSKSGHQSVDRAKRGGLQAQATAGTRQKRADRRRQAGGDRLGAHSYTTPLRDARRHCRRTPQRSFTNPTHSNAGQGRKFPHSGGYGNYNKSGRPGLSTNSRA